MSESHLPQQNVCATVRPSGRPALSPLRVRACLAALSAIVLVACQASDPKAMYDAGRQAHGAGDRAAAVVHYKSALQADPGFLDARLALAQALLETGDADGAIAEARRVLTDGGPAKVAYPLLSKALLQTGDYKRAVHALEGVKTGDPRADATVRADLALAWSGLGDRAKAEAAIVDALASDPAFPHARLLQARILASRGEVDRTQAVVTELLTADPGYHDASVLQAELHQHHGRRVDAIATLEAAAKLGGSITVHAMLARLYIEQGQRDEAARQVESLRALSSWHPHTTLAEAQLALLDGDLERARERAERLASRLPDNATVVAFAGLVESRLGSWVRATTNLRKAISLEPGLTAARIELARVELRLGQFADALRTLRPLTVGENASPLALALASEAHLRLGDAKAADDLLKRAATAAPDNAALKAAALVRRFERGEVVQPLAELDAMASRSTDTIADEALFAARLARGEFDAALSVLDRLQKKQPDNAQHFELRGRVLLARRDFGAAREAFEKALQLEPRQFSAVLGLVTIDQIQDRPESAQARLQKVLQAEPSHGPALLAMAEFRSRQGAPYEEVVELFRRAATADSLSVEPRLRLIELAMRKRLHKQALAFAREALAAHPGDPRVLDAVGLAQLRAGDVEQSLSTFRSLSALVPASVEPYLRMAEVYGTQGQQAAALTAVRKALEVQPLNGVAQRALVDLLINTRKPEEASEYVRRQRQLRPSDPAAFALEATFHARMREPDRAIAVLREGVAKTGSPDLAGLLFSTLLERRDDAGAMKFASTWLRQSPGDAAFEYLVSVRDIGRGDLASAEARLRRVVAAYPTNAVALNNLAWVLVQRGGSGAVELARRALSLGPDQPSYMDTLAMALAADGKVADALTLAQKALELAPEDPSIQLGLARVAVQAGRKDLARQQLDRLAPLGDRFPGHEEVRQLQAKL